MEAPVHSAGAHGSTWVLSTATSLVLSELKFLIEFLLIEFIIAFLVFLIEAVSGREGPGRVRALAA